MSTETMPLPAPPMRLLTFMLRVLVSALLAYAGGQKLLSPDTFVEQVANYQWFPALAPWVAVVLPPVELTAAVALWVPAREWRLAAAWLAVGLFAVFTIAVTRAYWLDINVDCGCFGVGSGAIGPLTVLRNLALTAAALWLVRRPSAGSSPAH